MLFFLVKIICEWDDFISCCGVCYFCFFECESVWLGWWINVFWDVKNEWRRIVFIVYIEVVWDDVWCLYCDCILGNWRSFCCFFEIYLFDCEILV